MLADENNGSNFIDRFSDGLLDGAGKIVKGIGNAVSSAITRTANWSNQAAATSDIVVTAQRREGAAQRSSQGPSSTTIGLSLTMDQYLAVVKDGLWEQVQGIPPSGIGPSTGFANDAAVSAAAKKTQALPSISTEDLQAPPDLAAFVREISTATAKARIGGRDQDYEKSLSFSRNSDNQIVVTAISIVGKQGGGVSGLLTSGVIGIAHVHYNGLVQPPHSGDSSIAKVRNLPSLVIGSSGKNVWEIGRINGNYAIRSVIGFNNYGRWEIFQGDASKYKIYHSE